MSITEASAQRREPACRHFGPDGKNGTCGGCSLQHLSDQPYHAYKREPGGFGAEIEGPDA